MSNQWLRLWHDMPNDPKWRTIARTSGQPISLVQAIYIHLLVDASRNVTRGHAHVTLEDLASALDVTEDAVTAVLSAMQGRVLEERRLTGWELRQPKREDSGDETTGAKSAAQRKKEQREREKQAKQQQAEQPKERPRHETSRDVTLDKDKEEDKEIEKPPQAAAPGKAERVSRAVTLSTYLADCKQAGVKPIPDDHFIRPYCRDAGIGADMLALAWIRFKEEHTAGQRKAKRYADWPGTFANSVKDRWYKFWVVPLEGDATWTSEGLQERKVIDARLSRKQQEAEHEPA